MMSLWYVLLYVMTDLMAHGGDGGGQDPPFPGGFGLGQGHYEDASRPRRKTRGKAKNLGLQEMVVANGGPLTLEFDRHATFEPMGNPGKFFKRAVGSYMWNHIPFDKDSWDRVPEAQKNAMVEHLKASFDMDKINDDPDKVTIMETIEHIYKQRYNNRKANAKKHFNENGGRVNDIERALRSIPQGVQDDSWRTSVEFFMSDKHQKRSATNRLNRQAQTIVNRGGSSTYINTSYGKAMSHLETYRKAHTLRDGTIDPLAVDTMRKLDAEFASLTQPANNDNEEGPSQPVNEVAVFEKVLKPRRKWIRGIGYKPSSKTQPDVEGTSSQPPPPPPPVRTFTEDEINALFENPSFLSRLSQVTGSNIVTQRSDEEENDEESHHDSDE